MPNIFSSLSPLGKASLLLGKIAWSGAKRLVTAPNPFTEMEVAIREMRLDCQRGLRFERRQIKILFEDAKVMKITSDHTNPQWAAIGKAFETLLEHPLVKKYRRNTLRLIHDSEGFLIGDGIAALRADKYVILGKDFDPKQLALATDVMAHEIGHHLRQAQGSHQLIKIHWNTRREEEAADAIAAVISPRHGRAFQDTLSDLLKSSETEQELERVNQGNWLSRTVKKLSLTSKDIDIFAGAVFYPSASQRIKNMEAIASRKTSAEGVNQVEREMDRRLERLHRAMFPHHYDRPGGMTRGR